MYRSKSLIELEKYDKLVQNQKGFRNGVNFKVEIKKIFITWTVIIQINIRNFIKSNKRIKIKIR